MDLRLKPHHVAISVRDIEKSINFYNSLGFKEVHRFKSDTGELEISHLKLGDLVLEIFWVQENSKIAFKQQLKANNTKELGVKHLGLATVDLDRAMKEMREAGFILSDDKIAKGRTDIYYFFVQDPDGYWVEIVQDDRGY